MAKKREPKAVQERRHLVKGILFSLFFLYGAWRFAIAPTIYYNSPPPAPGTTPPWVVQLFVGISVAFLALLLHTGAATLGMLLNPNHPALTKAKAILAFLGYLGLLLMLLLLDLVVVTHWPTRPYLQDAIFVIGLAGGYLFLSKAVISPMTRAQAG